MVFNSKAIIFDMDGTLVDNIPYHEESWIVLLREHGIHVDPENFAAQNHGTLEEMIIRFFGNDLSKEKIHELGLAKEKSYQDLYKPHIKGIDGLIPFLKKLKNNKIRTGLATMGVPASIDFILGGLDIKGYFDEITSGIEVLKGKPDPDIFLKTIHKLQVDGKDTLAVEDSMGGVKAAKDAGLKVVGITTTHSEEELRDNGCTFVIHDYTNIDLK